MLEINILNLFKNLTHIEEELCLTHSFVCSSLSEPLKNV